jgi:hypothetical protein
MSRNDWEPDDVKIIDPSSVRGRELLDEAAHLTPDTQGDPPPAPAEPEPMKDETRRAFEAGFQWAINGTDKYGEYNGGSVDDGYAAFRQHQPAEATPARAPGEPLQDALLFIRAEAERTKGNGPLGELWASVLEHAEQIAVDCALADAVKATQSLRDQELEAEHIPSGLMEMRLRAPSEPQGWQSIDSAPRNKHVLVYMHGTAGLGFYRAVLADWQDAKVNPRWRPTGYTALDEFPAGATITHWTLPTPPGEPGEPR